MKNLYKLIAITALVAVIGFSFIACDNGSGGGGGGGKTLTSITAVYTPTTEIFPDTTLDTLKEGLTVTAHYSDGTTASVTAYNLSIEGEEFTVGENTVTVTYTEGGVTKTTTFKVTVDVLTHAHNWQLKEVINPATCTTAGMGKWECTNITPSHYEDLEIAALGHDWNDTYTTIADATETTDGVEAITCKRDSSHTKDSRFNGEYATGTAGLNINSNGIVRKGTVTSGAVYIPAYYYYEYSSAYIPVTAIWGDNTGFTDGAFYNTTITSITIGRNVTRVGATNFASGAFRECTSLESVTFEEGSQLITIGQAAFYNCTSLASITLPANVTTIGQQAFYQCTSLTSINIPAGVTNIGNGAFLGCSSLTSVTFEGTIPSSGFLTAFPSAVSDIRAKFYATDPANGTPGTYIITSGSGTAEDPFVWEKQ